ncbi:MAG TPA: hypothetical protein VIV57_12375 [Anaeromyxobacter sp.]
MPPIGPSVIAGPTISAVVMLERQGNVVIWGFRGAKGEAQVIAQVIKQGDRLILKGTHIQGQASLKEALEAAKAVGRSEGVKKVIIEPAKQTTGRMRGRFPHTIEVDTGL